MSWIRKHIFGTALTVGVLALIAAAAVVNLTLLDSQEHDKSVGTLSPIIDQEPSRAKQATLKVVVKKPASKPAKLADTAAQARTTTASRPAIPPTSRPLPVATDDSGGDRPSPEKAEDIDHVDDDNSGHGGGSDDDGDDD